MSSTDPTTRETADHAELARTLEALAVEASASRNIDGAESMMVSVQTIYDLIVNRNALLSEIAALRGEMERSLPSISLDGEHAISDHRRWLARQLLDSRLDDGEAYSIVAYHPAITDLRTTQAERQRDELRRAVEAAANLFRLCTEPTMFENASTLNVYAQMTEWLVRNRPLIANPGADQ